MSHAEFVVQEALERLGFETFLPAWIEKTQWSDRVKDVTRPLFPGYLFVRSDTPQLGLARVAGVIDVLPSSLKPEPVDSDALENIRMALRAGLPATPCPYITGDVVTIERGPLAGVRGIVQRTKNGTQVIVRIDMLQRAVSVTVDAMDVAKAA